MPGVLPFEPGYELPGVFAAVLPALVLLAADAGEGGAAYAVFAVVVVNGQNAAPGRIRDLFDPVAGNDPPGFLPAVLLLEGGVFEGLCLFDF